MRSRGAGLERWRALGRLLPRDVRERVFDPAFSDLVRAWLERRDGARPLPFAVRALCTYAGCVPIAAPRLFIERGRLTRLGRVCLMSFGVVALLVLLMTTVYEGYPPP